MRYVSLKNSSLTYFNTKGKISELTGSSKYNVFDDEIILKEKRTRPGIESTRATTDFLQSIIDTNSQHDIAKRLQQNFDILLDICILASFNQIDELIRLGQLSEALKKLRYVGEDSYISIAHFEALSEDKKKQYFKLVPERSAIKKINKTKVKGKMNALFNLKCSRKFMAFYSVSFPAGTTDDEAFICWNYFLTCLRKKFNLTNYVWVSERQKNGILHFHMLTNNYMPILSINRAMAIIINNQVLKGLMNWGASSLDKFNGVDVDSIFNSKRHKKTGKNMNPAEVRNWIAKYVTKYVTKNNDKFTHLCWHCSRSVSLLFVSTVVFLNESVKITSYLPTLRHLYYHVKSDFNDVWIFLFVPPAHLFEKINMYNDLIFAEHEPLTSKKTLKIKLNAKTI